MVSFFSSARMRSRSACSWRSVAAFFSQAALSSKGNTPLYWPGLRIERVTTRGRRDVHVVGQLEVARG